MRLTHRGAVWAMVAATLMWSIAGVVTRQLEAARSFEITFWRSAFNALALMLLLTCWKGAPGLIRELRQGGRALWLSGACWAVMFTAFMVALTLTSVANLLVTMSVGPLLTALLARVALDHRMPARTWAAIALAGGGIAWMFGREVDAGGARHAAGMAIALAVPIAAAVNWTLLQHLRGRSAAAGGDMLGAVLIGALGSALVTLPAAVPWSASPADLAWLALLGVVQLAIPCLLAVAAAAVLSGPEISLLGLLEVVFGVAWAWLGAGETPSAAVQFGGLLVLAALALNEWLAMRSRGADARSVHRQRPV